MTKSATHSKTNSMFNKSIKSPMISVSNLSTINEKEKQLNLNSNLLKKFKNNQSEKQNANEKKLENLGKENRMENRRKQLKEKLIELKEESKLLSHEINELQTMIENNTAEIEVLENYTKFVENLHCGTSNLKRLEMIKNMKKKNSDNNEALFSAASELQKEVIQREKNLKNLKEDNELKKEERERLKNQSIYIKEKINSTKEELDTLKNKLMLHYHLLLSEGTDTRNEGLVWIIKSIWNLGENVIISYMPDYLDEKCIDFLFSIAHKDFELHKMNEDLDYTKQNLRNSIAKIGLKNSNNKKGGLTYDPTESKLEYVKILFYFSFKIHLFHLFLNLYLLIG